MTVKRKPPDFRPIEILMTWRQALMFATELQRLNTPFGER